MNINLVLRFLFIIFFAFFVSFVICLIIAINIEPKRDSNIIKDWILVLSIAGVLGSICYMISRRATPRIFRREALGAIGLGWLIAAALGALPFWLIIDEFTVPDAIFEISSGLSTTGATVIAKPESIPLSLLFWRGLSQWIGGLGFVIFFVALLGFVGAEGKILYSREASGQWADVDSPRVQEGLFKVLAVYMIISAMCCFAYYLEGMTFFDAITNMFATVSTGGYCTKNESFASFNSDAIEWTGVIFMILGATNFLLMAKILDGNFKRLLKSSEWQLFLTLIFISTFIAAILINIQYEDFSFYKSLRIAAFNLTSVATTTGFSSFDYNKTAFAVHILIILLMLIGGCSGSTAGGLKVIRVITTMKICAYQIKKAFRPRLVQSIQIDQKPLEPDAQQSVLTHVAMTGIAIFGSLLLISFFEPNLSFEGNLAAIINSISNVGNGLAEVGPASNFGLLSGETKILLSILMILGRLEFLAILVLFVPSFWRKYT